MERLFRHADGGSDLENLVSIRGWIRLRSHGLPGNFRVVGLPAMAFYTPEWTQHLAHV